MNNPDLETARVWRRSIGVTGQWELTDRSEILLAAHVADKLTALEQQKALADRLAAALRKIVELPSLPEAWSEDEQCLLVGYREDAQPYHIAREALKAAWEAENG